jgi:hypothetical protein
VSEKPSPSDIDVLVRATVPTGTREAATLEDIANAAYMTKLHTFLTENLGSIKSQVSKKRFPSFFQSLYQGTQERYPGAKLVRLWGAAPLGIGLEEYLNSIE